MFHFIFVYNDVELIFDSFDLFFSDKFTKHFGIRKFKFFGFTINETFKVKIFDLWEI